MRMCLLSHDRCARGRLGLGSMGWERDESLQRPAAAAERASERAIADEEMRGKDYADVL